MGREEAVNSFEDLKQHSIPDHQIREIQMTKAVMTRITALQAGGNIRKYAPARRFSLYATVLFIVLLASASVYAASEFIQIRDHAGDVKIQSAIRSTESQIIPYNSNNDAPIPTYRDRVLELVEPGQVLAYYVRDSHSNPNIQYLHNTSIFTSYDDFKELLVRTSAPIIEKPANLPAGFEFKYGSVMPLYPNEHDDQTAAEYSRLIALFQQRASASPDQDLFVEEVDWSEANISELEYAKGLMNLRIQAMKNMIGMEISFPAEYKQTTLNIDGIETIFASGSINNFQSYEAIWYNESQSTHYQVTASGNVELTEEQFQIIVKSIIDS